eukprot:TRINITY_DN43417_c0_g1_i2.p1 TRINITY_DN43417_c0_g1~~TRINITY_DN43417_c0_g1_i2.p1  ORF type:complete len:220 (+),score=34.48 TRINITY_DN43417_c0_g1_i2:176-835(+)
MSYTSQHAFRIREHDVGRPAPHNRHSTYSHHQYDTISNMSHYRLGDIRPQHMAAPELSRFQANYQPASIRNLGETRAPHDSYSEADVRNDSMSALHRLTNNDPKLTSLTLWNEDFGYKHAIWLKDGLAKAVHLQHLDLRFCKLGDESARAIGEGLKSNRTLTQLVITPNNWSSDVGKKWIDRALAYGGWVATNDSIQHLDARDARSPVYHRLASSLPLR